MSLKKACFAGKIFGSFVKGVPLCFCGDYQLIWGLPFWMLEYYSAGLAGLFQTTELLLEHAKYSTSSANRFVGCTGPKLLLFY